MSAPIPTLKAPFPWFGGKSRVASAIFERLGRVRNYCEPFCGSCALLLANPSPAPIETVNDADCWLVNFWRAVQAEPDAVAAHADWPVVEADLFARGNRLFYGPETREFVEQMRADPDFYDAKVAGWWVWGQCAWIGHGWGPRDGGQHVKHIIPHLSTGGNGIHRQLPHLAAGGRGINRKIPHLADGGRGINRTIPTLADGDRADYIRAMIRGLAVRLRDVRVCCGDWTRVMGPAVTTGHGLTGIVLDPPYSHAERDPAIYSVETDCAAAVRAWCAEHGDDPLLRIALCGYRCPDHEELTERGWTPHFWKANGGYGNKGSGRGRENAGRETVWFSPHCRQTTLDLSERG